MFSYYFSASLLLRGGKASHYLEFKERRSNKKETFGAENFAEVIDKWERNLNFSIVEGFADL